MKHGPYNVKLIYQLFNISELGNLNFPAIDNSGLLGSNTASLCKWQPTFRKKTCRLNLQVITVSRNVLSTDAASHARKL